MAYSGFDIQQRYRYGILLCGLALGLMLLRMLYLQTIRHEDLYAQSESNRLRVQPVIPMRGLIFDRDRRLLVENRASYSLSVIPAEISRTHVLSRLATALQMDENEIKQRMAKNLAGRFQPALIKRDIGFDRIAVFEEQSELFPGTIYSKDQVREYHEGLGEECLTGYVGEVSPDEMKKLDPSIYRPGTMIGKAGVEKYYDRELRGIDGTEYVEVTASGQLLGAMDNAAQIPAVPGNDLILTIDNDIQKAASEVFGDFCCGAAVVMDPRNGEILALVSKPPNDANVFSSVMTNDLWQSILTDPNNPLLNRPVDGLYPPGSTYKLVMAGAALETGTIDRTTMFSSCNGGYRFGNRVFHCWEKRGHGRLTVVNAIEQSCDVFFYQLGLRLGLEEYTKFSRACGFGQRTGIDLSQEAAGLIPSTAWYNRKLGKSGWTQAVLLNLAIGQGEVLVTPLQLAQFYCGIANNGRVFRPHLLRSIIGPDGRETSKGGELAFTLPFSKETLQILREGAYSVVQGPSGTAHGARIPGTTVAGKTGTAQNPHGQDHSWFVGYAPADNPEILACVIVENAGHGSTYAAPAVRNIIKAYLNKHHLPGADTTAVAGVVP
jgi:penicillin-binding protein 2